jgi:hypothetical protein
LFSRRFQAKACPGLDPGWKPVRVKKRVKRPKKVSQMELLPGAGLYPAPVGGRRLMLVERGLRVMNVGVVGDAYAIASNYLRRSGAISGALATNDRLLKIIAELFQHGERNKIRLANKAIAKFEAAARH